MSNKQVKGAKPEIEKSVEIAKMQIPEVNNTTEQAETEPQRPVNVDLLVNRIAELEKQLTAKQPQNLEDARKYFQEKQRKINELESFKTHYAVLNDAVVKVDEKVKSGDFEAKLFRLSLNNYNDYREGDKLFSVTNPLIIAECMVHIMQQVAAKIDQLKREIEQ